MKTKHTAAPIKEIPNEMTLCCLHVLLMPQGEILCLGKTVGWFRELKDYLYKDSAPELLKALQVIKGQTEDDFSYETEYDGTMIIICLFCGGQDGKHAEDCIKEKVIQAIAKAEGLRGEEC